MRYVLSSCLLVLFLSGCSELLTNGSAPESEASKLTFVNATDRPIAVTAFNKEEMPLIDPRPALSAGEFEERKIEVGAAAGINDASYEKGNAAFVLIYAKCDCALSEQIVEVAGADAAPWTKDFTLSAEELEQMNYRVEVESLE